MGTSNLRAAGTLVKLSLISICQSVSKDGFQLKDLLAPISSPIVRSHVTPVVEHYKEVMAEAVGIKKLSVLEQLDLAKSLYDGLQDLSTEVALALAKMEAMKDAKGLAGTGIVWSK